LKCIQRILIFHDIFHDISSCSRMKNHFLEAMSAKYWVTPQSHGSRCWREQNQIDETWIDE
jgi:hypothetical protein